MSFPGSNFEDYFAYQLLDEVIRQIKSGTAGDEDKLFLKYKEVGNLLNNKLKTDLMSLSNKVNNISESFISKIKEIHTGGAEGIDHFFGKLGEELDISVYHHIFRGHKRPINGRAIIHEQEELDSQDELLKRVLDLLKRPYPTVPYVRNLLLRNMLIAEKSDAIFGIGYFPEDEKDRTYTVDNICGGTAYSCCAGFLLKKLVLFYELNTKSGNCFFLEHPSNGFELRNYEKIGCVGTRNIPSDFDEEYIKKEFKSV
jgi:hypothetical protein